MNGKKSSSQVPIRMRNTQKFVFGSIIASLPVNAFLATGDVASNLIKTKQTTINETIVGNMINKAYL